MSEYQMAVSLHQIVIALCATGILVCTALLYCLMRGLCATEKRSSKDMEVFGYYDHFNDVLYRGTNAIEQAKKAAAGGNLVTPLHTKRYDAFIAEVEADK